MYSKNNTVIVKKDMDDKFYTKPSVASKCMSTVNELITDINLWIEPSAGNGSFYNIMPSPKKGYDIKPECKDVVTQDFFETDDTKVKNYIMYIGNPPFGKNANLAISFFNHCADNPYAIYIGFIVPKTFKKLSVQNRLSLDFKLIYDEDLPKNSFLLNGEEYDVPCCFQIWQRQFPPRQKIKAPTNIWFTIVKEQKDADICMRRAGGSAGKILTSSENYTKSSTYFIKSNVKDLKAKLESIDFSKYINATAGIKSLSITEILLELEKLDKDIK
jgi:hypothetical protein